MTQGSPRVTAAPWQLAALCVLCACDARVQLVEPRASVAPPTVLMFAASDTALASRAGWHPGVPATTVHLRRHEDPTILTFTADERGVLSLTELPLADYWVWVEKRPTGQDLETPTLAPPALGGGRRMSLGPGVEATVPLRGQESGSLVISEFYYHSAPVSLFGEGVNYHFHWYLELYNNSDTTIYLDGKIVGAGFNYWVDAELWPCTETEPFRNDPRGVWSQMFQAFPGAGHDHPLSPGKTVVIAEQAIDHGTIYPGLPDMSHADFQFHWETRAMNPAVPAMLPIQLRTAPSQTMFLGPAVPFVAEAVDIGSLERMGGRYTGVDEALFPREKILDLAVLWSTGEVVRSYTGTPYCGNLVHPALDGLSAFVKPVQSYQGDSTHLLTAQRKLLSNGHLQRTGTSAVDWEIRLRSPGKIP